SSCHRPSLPRDWSVLSCGVSGAADAALDRWWHRREERHRSTLNPEPPRPYNVHALLTASLMRVTRRLVSAVCLFILLGSSVPAAANVRADFDGDGIPDLVTVEAGSSTVIRVSLSSMAPPVFVELRDRPLALIATDINRDGRIDLAGLSRRRGLFLFRNED